MVSLAEMTDLVRAHAQLDEPMEAAIWIRRDDREAWLVEVIPSITADDHPERPIAFNPGITFRHPLNLIASDFDGLRRAIEVDAELAREIAHGVALHGAERSRELQEVARAAHGHSATG